MTRQALSKIFRWPVRVYYEDTDVSGVVYHANYLRFFERARTEWLRDLGYSQERLLRDFGVAFTVADLDIQYRVPARLDDLLIATVALAEHRRVSLTFAQTLLDAADEGRVLATLRARVVSVDAHNFKLRPLPDIFGAVPNAAPAALPMPTA